MTPDRFRPAPWLANPHAQTVFAAYGRRSPAIILEPETLELADGDFLDLSWSWPPSVTPQTPIVIVLHGIGGSQRSKYVRGLMAALRRDNVASVLLHFRGLLRPNRLPETYHSGRSEDLSAVMRHLEHRRPNALLAAVGFSLGGNVLLKYLGESGRSTRLVAAAAVSVPYDLAVCATAIDTGLARVYQRYLLRGMHRMAAAKFDRTTLPIERPRLSHLRSFYAFDTAVTAPLNGFASAADYYARASCRPYLAGIRVPTLAIHAADDPFMTPAAVPTARELSADVCLEVSPRGGHVGFVAAGRGMRHDYWLERRIPVFLRAPLGVGLG